MNLREARTTNLLLLMLVIPLGFYLLKVLAFIFVPLVMAMFIALLFLPLLRWLSKKKVPKPVSILLVVMILMVVFRLAGDDSTFKSRNYVCRQWVH